jgi:transposase-like protein
MRTGRKRCAQCKYDFTPHQLPLRLMKDEWREILHLFLMELSSNSIIEQTGLDKKRVLRALLRVRIVLTTDVPAIFSGTVEVDETYLRGS